MKTLTPEAAAVHVDAFDDHTQAIQVAVDAILDHAETMLELIDAAKQAVACCDRTAAKLRRAEETIDQGPLNSVSAVVQHNRSLVHHLDEFNHHVMRLFDVRREMSALHPQVVTALRPTPGTAP
jgi:hypothetical protein